MPLIIVFQRGFKVFSFISCNFAGRDSLFSFILIYLFIKYRRQVSNYSKFTKIDMSSGYINLQIHHNVGVYNNVMIT